MSWFSKVWRTKVGGLRKIVPKEVRKAVPKEIQPGGSPIGEEVLGTRKREEAAREAAFNATQLQNAQSAFNNIPQVPGLMGAPTTPFTGPGAPSLAPGQGTPPGLFGLPNGQYGLLAQQMSGVAQPGQVAPGPPLPQSATPNRFEQFGPAEMLGPETMMDAGIQNAGLFGFAPKRSLIPQYRPYGK